MALVAIEDSHAVCLTSYGEMDLSIKPSEFNRINPNRILPLHAEVEYQTPDIKKQCMHTYLLEVGMQNAAGDDLAIW